MGIMNLRVAKPKWQLLIAKGKVGMVTIKDIRIKAGIKIV